MAKQWLALIFCVVFSQMLYAAPTTAVQAVVFDFGGVVAKANKALMVDFFSTSLNMSASELKAALQEMQEFVSKGGSEKEFWEQYAISNGKVLPPNWFNEFDRVIKEAISEIPGTIQIVKALQSQGYQTAMLSDVTQYQANIIRKMGYYDLFRPVLLSYEMGVEKPNPEAFKILLKELKVPASSVLFIDDKSENVEAAKKEGIDAIQFTDPQQLEQELEKRDVHIHQMTANKND